MARPMKTPIAISLYLLLTVLPDLSLAQETGCDSLLTHYPIRIGNVWDYSGDRSFFGSYSFPLWRLITATNDSVHTNGKKYVVLEWVTYDMGLRANVNSLGEIRYETKLQRVDTTSLNVYEVAPLEKLFFGDELLIDSLLAKLGDTIISNSALELTLLSIRPEIFLGESRVQRELSVLQEGILSSNFITTEKLGQTSWSGGEGEITSFTLQAAIVDGDTTGTLLRLQEAELLASEKELVFSEGVKERRIVFSNHGKGLTIIDSVKVADVSLFYSKPSYHQGPNFFYPDTIFSRGHFLVFPQDSIFLDIFIRESSLEQSFDDTLRVYASGLNGQMLPRLDIPIKIDPIVSVQTSPENQKTLPEIFDLRAYPNPLSSQSSLKISYQLSKTEYVKVQIYDILGRRVAILNDQEMTRGVHQSTWDSRGVPSGIYFVAVGNKLRKEVVKVKILK